ncbi:MAG: tRNA-dihydrouridine synthase DusB [Nitrospira sp.]|jgi:tRNA-dihydrouridine synthase|nr:MAG: tRNA-dihydrouridine synthase DusB [Nitrospira sp.]
MDGVTDACFRSVIAQQGKPDVSFTEFTHVHDVCHGAEVHMETLLYSERERPIVAQLYGKDPNLFYLAAQAVCELGFDGLDINMGCPSKSVASSGSGAGLIRTPELARTIMQAAQRGIEDWAGGQTLERAGFKPARVAVFERLNRQRGKIGPTPRRRLPLSVKTRLGYETVTVEGWVEELLMEQPAVISLHGRTLRQMYRGTADWSAIGRAASLVKGTGTLLVGNGDIQGLDDIGVRVRETGVDGVLVGRGVLGAPWFFRSKERARMRARGMGGANVGRDPGEVSLNERFAVLVDHAQQFQALVGEKQFYRMRKHLGWYCKGFPHAALLRAQMVRVSSVEELHALLEDFQNRPEVTDIPQAESADEPGALVSRCS